MKKTIQRIKVLHEEHGTSGLSFILTANKKIIDSNPDFLRGREQLTSAIKSDLPADYQASINDIADHHLDLIRELEDEFRNSEINIDDISSFVKNTAEIHLVESYAYFFKLHQSENAQKQKKKPWFKRYA